MPRNPREIAETVRDRLNQGGEWSEPLVTEVFPLDRFYPAEDDHQNYFARHTRQPYCQAVIQPKMAKYAERYE